MKTETVKCHEVVDGKKVFVAEGALQIAENLEDIIQMTEGDNPECPESQLVTLFNASRRIEFQRKLKAGNSDKTTAKATLTKIELAAKSNPELAKLLQSFGMSV